MSFQSVSRLGLPALVFTAAAQGIAIPSPPTWPSGQCTDKSLTIPSWVIADYKVSASGTVTFGITNRAADSHGTVTCAKSQPCTVAGNSQLAAAVSEGSSGPVVTIEESWTCNDREKALTFNATGSATVFSLEKSSSGDASSPITYLTYATLSEPVPLTPVQPSPPPGYSLPTCADVSKSPALFTVTDISFKNVTRTQCKTWYGTIFCLDPRPPTEVVYAGLYLNLTVRNEAIQHTLSCDLTMPNATAPDVVTPVRCTGGNFNEIALDISMAGTQPEITIAVDEMWYCLENPNQNTKPTAILATGAAPITLSCISKPGIFGTPDDVITTCSQQSGGPLGIKGKLKEKKEQPAYSLVTAPPTSGGCLVTSLVKPEWKITNPSFSTNFAKSTTNQSLWELGVKLGTPRFEHWFYVFAGENKYPGTDDPDTWYRCEWSIPGGWLPWDCKVQYNYHTTTLGLDVIWGCEEKDPAHPLFFHSTGSIVMPHDQSWYCGNSNPNRTTCAYQGLWEKTFPVPHITVGLTNVEPPKPW